MTKQKRTSRRFTAEFKAEMVKPVKQSNRTMADVAMELGISAKSVLRGSDHRDFEGCGRNWEHPGGLPRGQHFGPDVLPLAQEVRRDGRSDASLEVESSALAFCFNGP